LDEGKAAKKATSIIKGTHYLIHWH